MAVGAREALPVALGEGGALEVAQEHCVAAALGVAVPPDALAVKGEDGVGEGVEGGDALPVGVGAPPLPVPEPLGGGVALALALGEGVALGLREGAGLRVGAPVEEGAPEAKPDAEGVGRATLGEGLGEPLGAAREGEGAGLAEAGGDARGEGLGAPPLALSAGV